MAAQALPLAKLLAGEMPHDIEEVFAACKLTLLPALHERAAGDLHLPGLRRTRASTSRPSTTSSPSASTRTRSRSSPGAASTQEELLEQLRARRARATGKRASSDAASTDAGLRPTSRRRCRPCSIASGAPARSSGELHVSPLAAEAPDALLRQLGPPPVDVGDQNLVELLGRAYVQLASAAERRALAE